MEYRSKTLKKAARAAMRAAAPSAVLVTLVYYLLTSVLPNVITLLTPSYTVEDLLYNWSSGMWITLFLTILLALYGVVMDFGYQCWALRAARGQNAGFGTLLEGFGMVGRVLLMELQIFLRILGWALCLSLVYSFLALSISAALSFAAPVLAVVLLVILSAAFYLAVFVITLRYELSPFLLYDYPEAGSGAAVRRSAQMTGSHMWELVKLYLSFWPWYLASLAITLAVFLIVLYPISDQLAAFLYSGNLDMATVQIQAALNGTLATVLPIVLGLPIELFFHPYRRISLANFYRALSQEPVAPSFSGESF